MDEERPKSKKKIIVIGILLLALVVFALYYSKKGSNILGGSGNSTGKAGSNADTAPVIPPGDKAKQEEAYLGYLQAGQKYKSEGDAGNKDSYYKAIEEYKKASDVAEQKVWIPFLNLGNVYRFVGDYDNAEKSYNKAIEIAPDNSIFSAKIDMYRYELKKPVDEVNSLYEEALSKTGDNFDIMTGYAAYLRDNGNNEESLKYWKIVSGKYPDDQRYKDEIAGLEAKISNK
jgi:tetratricopeptide (TPR) repeat protein